MTRRSDELTAALINSCTAMLNAKVAALNAGNHLEEAYNTAMADHDVVLTKIMEIWD